MDILNSGSFVPLDNRGKIEQLIFTAKTLATEVSQAEGFQSSGPTNHQLGLEMWKGAEYMCRAHEEATIRNLFLSKFLERLREIERQSARQPNAAHAQSGNPPPARTGTQPVPVPIAAEPSREIVPASQPQEAQDEYLGVVSPAVEIGDRRPSYADECKPDFEREFAETNITLDPEESISNEGAFNEAEPNESTHTRFPQAGTHASTTDVSGPSFTEEPAVEEADAAEPSAPDLVSGVDSIVLSEKEPYNFDSCTVTAVIQLLPESREIRKSVISIRSHDFAPQISISDISSGDVHEGIKQCLETALGQYRTNLPALAAEKIKKQKPASKKLSTTTAGKDAAAGPVPDIKTSEGSTIPPPAQNSEAGKDQQDLFAS